MNLKKNLFDRKEKLWRIPFHEENASLKIGSHLLTLLPRVGPQPIVIVCIGTDRSTGDSLGPLIGTLLEEKKLPHFYVYGTLDDPIHAMNLEEKIAKIYTEHHNPFIVGIDACLGRLKSVGIVQLGNGPVKPGAGVNKELPEVGHIHITGIVNVSGFMEFFVLQNTRLSLVLKMAKTIADGIYKASLAYHSKRTWTSIQPSNSEKHLP
ncbi:MAG: spore protease YyaC [Bacillus sp. (in: Bacteria)]|nr:spore protease YyaC [Bacillus sp. (in: firmicutes)]